NKVQIAEAVTEQYGVTVEAVRTQITKGKVKKTNRKRSQAIKGKRSDNKTAYVTLKKGDSITVFETEGEA
ncbi:50S ribosomal protein L23, partial [Candidatus Saccharibacteria bacterium]|nr:50S ribosomal protein L23 [Candidatus Saccharibacteria bacterium]